MPPFRGQRSPEATLLLPPPWCPAAAQLRDPLSLWPPAWVPLSIGRNSPKLHNELLIIPQWSFLLREKKMLSRICSQKRKRKASEPCRGLRLYPLSQGPSRGLGVLFLTVCPKWGAGMGVGQGSRCLPPWGPLGPKGDFVQLMSRSVQGQLWPLKRPLDAGWEPWPLCPWLTDPILSPARCLGKSPWMTRQRSTGTTTSRPSPRLCCSSSGGFSDNQGPMQPNK